MKTALIFGVSGQDGSYLAEFLLSKNYRVVGMVRRHSIPENQDCRIRQLPIETFYGDLLDYGSVRRIVREIKPDEVYNLAAQSHVRISFDMPEYTASVNGAAVLNVLNVILTECPTARLYQASSSEMFGLSVDADGLQRETTPMNPTSPYGCAKLFAYSQVRHYRRAYRLHVTNGILFNHTSPRRGSNFVESKIIKTAIQIKQGRTQYLTLGNLDAARDWGFAGDYVRAMWTMLQQDQADDYVIATGLSYTVRQLCNRVFSGLGMDYREHVLQDQKFMRAEELPFLCGDSSKAAKVLGWRATTSLNDVLDSMIEHWSQQ